MGNGRAVLYDMTLDGFSVSPEEVDWGRRWGRCIYEYGTRWRHQLLDLYGVDIIIEVL